MLVVGASVNHWTTKHGELISPDARVAQIDVDPRAIGLNRPVNLAIIGDAKASVRKLTKELEHRDHMNDRLQDARAREADRDPALARRALRGRLDRRVDRPAHAVDRAQRDAAAEQERRRRLGALPRLSGDVPRCPRRARLGVPERLSGRRPRPRQRDRRRDRASRPADGRRDRRRRRVHGARRARDRRAPEAEAAGADLRRRRVRRRGPPLRADGTRGHLVRFPDADLAAIAQAAGAEARRFATTDDLSIVDAGCTSPSRGRWCWTRRSTPRSARNGSPEAFRAG